MAHPKGSKFNLGHGLTLEIMAPDGSAFPFGAVYLHQNGQGAFIVCPEVYESAVSTAIALRVAARFFDKRAKAGSAEAF